MDSDLGVRIGLDVLSYSTALACVLVGPFAEGYISQRALNELLGIDEFVGYAEIMPDGFMYGSQRYFVDDSLEGIGTEREQMKRVKGDKEVSIYFDGSEI